MGGAARDVVRTARVPGRQRAGAGHRRAVCTGASRIARRATWPRCAPRWCRAPVAPWWRATARARRRSGARGRAAVGRRGDRRPDPVTERRGRHGRGGDRRGVPRQRLRRDRRGGRRRRSPTASITCCRRHVDHKTVLQEELARRGASVTYAVTETSGPPHQRLFTTVARSGISNSVGVRGRARRPPSRPPPARRWQTSIRSDRDVSEDASASEDSSRSRGAWSCSFHEGIAVIVGPNGSGKSNIADALQWAMATQAPSQLRAPTGPGRAVLGVGRAAARPACARSSWCSTTRAARCRWSSTRCRSCAACTASARASTSSTAHGCAGSTCSSSWPTPAWAARCTR